MSSTHFSCLLDERDYRYVATICEAKENFLDWLTKDKLMLDHLNEFTVKFLDSDYLTPIEPFIKHAQKFDSIIVKPT